MNKCAMLCCYIDKSVGPYYHRIKIITNVMKYVKGISNHENIRIDTVS